MLFKIRNYIIKNILCIILLIWFIFFCSISCSISDDTSSNSSSDDEDEIITELQGTWTGNEDLNGGTWNITFTGNTGFAEKLDGTESFTFSFVLDKSVTLNQIDIILNVCAGGAIGYEGKTSLGIYELNGNNLTLTCNQPDEGYRPIAFGPNNDDPTTVINESCRNWNLTKI